MAIGLEEKKSSSSSSSSSSLQKVLVVLFVLSAAFALFFFFGKMDFFKKTSQTKDNSSIEVKKIDIDFAFLKSNTISNLKSFPSFPSFFTSSSSSTPVESGRENPFVPYTADTASAKEGSGSETDTE